MPKPLQMRAPTWLSCVPSAMARMVLLNALMSWFSVPRGPRLNFLGALDTCLEFAIHFNVHN
jgi:hypothetical protein